MTRPPIITGNLICAITCSVDGFIATITEGGTWLGWQSRKSEKPCSVHPGSLFTVLAIMVPSGSASHLVERAGLDPWPRTNPTPRDCPRSHLRRRRACWPAIDDVIRGCVYSLRAVSVDGVVGRGRRP